MGGVFDYRSRGRQPLFTAKKPDQTKRMRLYSRCVLSSKQKGSGLSLCVQEYAPQRPSRSWQELRGTSVHIRPRVNRGLTSVRLRRGSVGQRNGTQEDKQEVSCRCQEQAGRGGGTAGLVRETFLSIGLRRGSGFGSDADIRFLAVAAVVSWALYHPAPLRPA